MSHWFTRLMIVTLATQLVTFGIRPALSYEALALGATPVELGILSASFSVLSLAAALPLGRAVDQWGEWAFVIVGPLAMAAVTLGLLAPQRMASLVAASALLGLGQLAASVGIQTSLAHVQDPVTRDKRLAVFTIVNSAGQLLAPAAAGLLAGTAGTGDDPAAFDGTAVFVCGTFTALLGLAAAVRLTRLADAPRAPETPSTRPSPRGFRHVMRVPGMPNAMLASFTVLASTDLLSVYLPALGQEHGLSVRTVGLLLAAQGAAALVSRLFMVRLIAALGRKPVLAMSMPLAAAGLAALPWTSWLPGLYSLMVVIGFGLGLGQPITLAWVAARAPETLKGTAMSVRLSSNRLGQTLVPVAVGALAGSAGTAAAFLSPALLLIVASAVTMRSRD